MRTGLSVSQAELAQRVGIHLQSVGKMESGKTNRLNSKSLAGLPLSIADPTRVFRGSMSRSVSDSSAAIKNLPSLLDTR